MRIRMLREVVAAANAAGTERRTYARDAVLTAEAEWQAWMFRAFIAEGWAVPLADADGPA